MIDKDLTRRGALRLASGLSLGGLVNRVTGQRPAPVPALAMHESPVDQGLDAAINTPLQGLARMAESARHRRDMMRDIHGLDPDVAALRSVSPVMKARIMMIRRLEEDDRFVNVAKIAWGG